MEGCGSNHGGQHGFALGTGEKEEMELSGIRVYDERKKRRAKSIEGVGLSKGGLYI